MAIFDTILAVGSIAAGLYGATQSRRAGETQAAASDRAATLQNKQFQQTRKDLAPWRETGTVALTELSDLYGLPVEGRPTPGGGTRDERKSGAYDRFFTTPSYEFRLGEGINALEKSAAARGTLNSGRMGRELVRYGQGVASTEFDTYANRLSGLAGVGQVATTDTGRFGATAATNAGVLGANAGEARASGYVGASNALSDSVENLLYFYGSRSGYGGTGMGQWINPDTNRLVTWG